MSSNTPKTKKQSQTLDSKIDLNLTDDELGLNDPQWFAIQCRSGYEKKVQETLQQKVQALGLEDRIFEIAIKEVKDDDPTNQTDSEEKKKKRRRLVQSEYAGYVFIKMHMDTETWFMIRNTKGVTGFLGSSGKGTQPIPLSRAEVKTILGEEDIPVEVKKTKVDYAKMRNFDLNQNVEIVSGPWAGRFGIVSKLQDDKGIAFVEIPFFGKTVEVKVEYQFCSKLEK